MYKPTKVTCRFDLLIIVFINIRLLQKHALPIAVSSGKQGLLTAMPNVFSGRIRMKIKCKGQSGMPVLSIYNLVLSEVLSWYTDNCLKSNIY